MTLTELQYIVALAKTKHFGNAAKACHVSQPTLSVAIKKLESSLGVSIFERHRNHIQLTDIGSSIVDQAQRVLLEASQIKEIAKTNQSQLNSPLKIGAIYTVAPYLFPTLIPAIKKRAPNMPLIIQEDYTENLREKLQKGELDAIFIALPFSAPDIIQKSLYDEQFVVVMRKDHKLAKKKHISKTDLKKEQVLLLGNKNCFRDQLIKSCPSCYTNDDNQTMEGASLETLRHMTASGFGITVLPSSATSIKYYNKILCIKSFKTNPPQRTIALAWRAGFTRTKAINAIIQSVSDSNLNGVCLIQ